MIWVTIPRLAFPVGALLLAWILSELAQTVWQKWLILFAVMGGSIHIFEKFINGTSITEIYNYIVPFIGILLLLILFYYLITLRQTVNFQVFIVGVLMTFMPLLLALSFRNTDIATIAYKMGRYQFLPELGILLIWGAVIVAGKKQNYFQRLGNSVRTPQILLSILLVNALFSALNIYNRSSYGIEQRIFESQLTTALLEYADDKQTNEIVVPDIYLITPGDQQIHTLYEIASYLIPYSRGITVKEGAEQGFLQFLQSSESHLKIVEQYMLME
ncbi:MAG: hypothetical protein R3A44_05890 [Caldilineaceae bacterium]